MSYSADYLAEASEVLRRLDSAEIDRMAAEIAALRARGGRLFVVGSGGGAAHAAHAVSDFRKLAGIEAYSPSDNVAELTARVNDEGWDSSYVGYLKGSRFRSEDMLLVLSVGGGDVEREVSMNIVRCLEYARDLGAVICGVVGRDGGLTARVARSVVVIPTVNPKRITMHTESTQALVCHLLVSHPSVQRAEARWESLH